MVFEICTCLLSSNSSVFTRCPAARPFIFRLFPPAFLVFHNSRPAGDGRRLARASQNLPDKIRFARLKSQNTKFA